MKTCFVSLLLLAASTALPAKNYQVKSPDGNLTVSVAVDKDINYSLSFKGQSLISASPVSMDIADGKPFGVNSKVKSAVTSSHKGIIRAFAYKKDIVKDNYNELTLKFNQKFTLLFRVYDDGAAYRFVSDNTKPITVKSEQATFNFAKDWQTFIPYVRQDLATIPPFEQQFNNSFENTYTHTALSTTDKTRLAFLPFIVEADNGVKMCITEADLENYPGMYVNNSDGGQTLNGIFANYPKEVAQGGHNNLQLLVKSRENYLVKAAPLAKFPWRVFCVSTQDKQLLDNDMVYRLAAPSRLADNDYRKWVKPGKVAWDWWNDWGIYNVNFKTGINTQTYKAYIDFASKHNIEYVILDEGWAVNKKADLMQVVPEIDLKEIISYGKEHNVDIILWAGWYALDRDMENVCRHYSEMGVKGFKIDFMNRDDAACVNFHYRAAAMAAKYHLMLDFHGTYKPTGLNRTYPNVVNFEGVAGLEQNKWADMKAYDQVNYDVTLPFARNLAGPMDYTQGAMLNGTKETFAPNYSNPMSQGTRCHQLAEYTIFYSPFCMLCDSPTHYDKEPISTDFIASAPTVWNETVTLDSKMGEYVAMARRNGNTWYIGVINNWTARDVTLDLSFLGSGNLKATAYADGINADRFAEDFTCKSIDVPQNRKLTVHLAPGGGYTMVVKR